MKWTGESYLFLNINAFIEAFVSVEKSNKQTQQQTSFLLTLSATAPWDVIDSQGGGVKVPGFVKPL